MNPGTPCQATALQLALFEKLIRIYPNTTSFLNFSTPFQLLIAVILSAQCTDAKVNEVTPILFNSFPDARTLAEAPVPVVERIIYSTGFYRAKAKNILATAKILQEKFAGEVPLDLESLTALPGVGRKTANVVRGQIGNMPAVIVDTHFKRVVRRLGLTEEQNPEKIEQDLLSLVPPSLQYAFSMAANRHGRALCTAKAPRCGDCPIQKLCPSG